MAANIFNITTGYLLFSYSFFLKFVWFNTNLKKGEFAKSLPPNNYARLSFLILLYRVVRLIPRYAAAEVLLCFDLSRAALIR